MNIEKNTALISIEEYDTLREYKKAVDSNETIKIFSTWDGFGIKSKPNDAIFNDIVEANIEVEKSNYKLTEKIDHLENKILNLEDENTKLKSELKEAKKDTFWKWITRK